MLSNNVVFLNSLNRNLCQSYHPACSKLLRFCSQEEWRNSRHSFSTFWQTELWPQWLVHESFDIYNRYKQEFFVDPNTPLVERPSLLFPVNLTDSQKKWFVEYFQKLCSSGLTETKNKVNHFQVCILIYVYCILRVEDIFLSMCVLGFFVKNRCACVHV